MSLTAHTLLLLLALLAALFDTLPLPPWPSSMGRTGAPTWLTPLAIAFLAAAFLVP